MKPVYILSKRTEIIQQLCQQLRMIGLDSVQGLEGDFLQKKEVTIAAQAHGVIIDIGDCDQPERVIEEIHARLPCEIWCSVIGNSDSIALAQTFAHHNIVYFNLTSQQSELAQAAVAGVQAKTSRQAICISVLVCKGGVGSTTIGYQLAKQISSQKNVGVIGTRRLWLTRSRFACGQESQQ
ncbi:hypothetical protein JZM24_17490 [Candidatus Sodalis endolongispinus]|uniref:Uncharacterized protein n=1 Tax=Candidatus Sodalis endolongispinus TaxID=2812662 RepID=A0ABS5YID1_9GAMM|nr:hypothetical protein [Candidatus Sodalis endolongispinus]MBT9433436.1 hypothetical protein [Candidatus Sodalis endolongispinus]